MNSDQQDRVISIVVPVYNEEAGVEQLYRRVKDVVDGLDMRYELILVDDGSGDGSWARMVQLRESDHAVKLLRLSRNFGHQAALTAGLDHCSGDVVFVLDADLQDPPELLPKMLQKLDEGYDVVYGVRRSRAGERWLKKATAAAFYRFINAICETKIPLDTGDFRLITRRVLDRLLQLREVHRFIRGMVSWTGFRQCPVYYDRDVRFVGETKYTVRKMLRLSCDAVFSFSSFPLKLVWCLAIVEMVCGIAAIFKSPMVALLLMLAGLQLMAIGVLASYIIRTYRQVQARPIYVVAQVEGISSTP